MNQPIEIEKSYAAWQLGDPHTTEQWARKALKKDKHSTPALCLLAAAQDRMGMLKDAKRTIDKAVRLSPSKADVHCLAAEISLSNGNIEAAFKSTERALALQEGHPKALTVQAELLGVSGRYEEAHGLLLAGLQKNPNDVSLTSSLSLIAPRLDKTAEAISTIESLLAKTPSSPHRWELLFALSGLLDQVGKFDRAFELAKEANRLQPAAPWSARDWDNQVNRIITTFTGASLRNSPKIRDASIQPILIVGMPRTGSTLVEQILSRHPEVSAGGELLLLNRMATTIIVQSPETATLGATKQLLEDLLNQYETALLEISHGSPIVTDKTLGNFIWLGLVQLILPAARIIHCHRDPLDTCLSCFVTGFMGGQVRRYSRSLEDLGKYYCGYSKLMKHWGETLDLPQLDVRYESLVNDIDCEARRIINFIEIDWHSECLKFFDSPRIARTASRHQVNRPIYQSSAGKSKQYESHLQPLVEILTRAGVIE